MNREQVENNLKESATKCYEKYVSQYAFRNISDFNSMLIKSSIEGAFITGAVYGATVYEESLKTERFDRGEE